MPNAHNSDEVYLFRCVIDQALHDLGSDEHQARMEAEEWFDVLNEDFLEVCDMAELDPKIVIDFFENNRKVLTDTEMTKSQRRKKTTRSS